MIVKRPAAIGDHVIETPFRLDFLLRQNVVAQIAARLTFARKEANPIQNPIVGLVVAMIFDMVPHAEGDGQQAVAYRLRVANSIFLCGRRSSIQTFLPRS